MLRIVKHPETGLELSPALNKKGEQITDSNGKPWLKAQLRTAEPVITINANGVGTEKYRSTFVTGTKEFFESLRSKLGSLTIQRQLSFNPFWEGQEPVRKGKNGDFATYAGNRFYQRFIVVPKGAQVADELWINNDASANGAAETADAEEREEMF